MQTKCPQCSQKLRVPDGMKNPLLRCPTCRNEFRLRSAQVVLSHGEVEFGSDSGLWRPSTPPSTVAASPEILPDIPVAMPAIPPTPLNMPDATRSPYPSFDTTTVRPRKSPAFEGLKNLARGSLGTITLVAVLFLLKGGPRVARHFFREKPPQPQPVQFERQPAQFRMDQNEALRRQIQEIRDRVRRERLRQQKVVDDVGNHQQDPPGQ